MKTTLEQRREELQRIGAGPNGMDNLCLILGKYINILTMPVGTLMIQTILEHEYPDQAKS